MDPKASETDAAKASTGPDAGKPRKTRPTVDIDLPSSAVKIETADETGADRASPEAEMPPPSPGNGSKWIPALIGLVAGAIGGFGAWQVTGMMDGGVGKLTAGLDQRLARLEQARPALPPEVSERLVRAERAMSEAGPREQALRSELGKLQAAISAEQNERSKALAVLGERSSTPAAQGNEMPGARLTEMQAQLDGFAPKLNSVSDQVANLSKSLGAVAGRDDLSRASALLVTTGLLNEAFQRHEVLGGILEPLRAMGASEAELSLLAPFASAAPATPAALLAELHALTAKNPGDQKPANKTEGDFFERLRAGAANLVDIRRTGEITGTDDNAHLARAEQALQRGDIAMALALVGRLTPTRAEGLAGWRAKAQQRMKAVEAIGKLRSESLARLSRAASATK